MKLKKLILSGAAIGACIGALETSAITITENYGVDASGRQALATFDQSAAGGTLTITLANTATGDLGNGDNIRILSALFFTLNGNPTLTPKTAIISAGSSLIMVNGTTLPTGGDVGGEWAYGVRQAGWPTSPFTGNNIVTAVGFDLAGITTGNFLSGPGGGNDLNGQTAVDGGAYGLTQLADNPATPSGNNGLFKPLIMNSVTLTFDVPAGYALSSVSDAGFAYGTSLGETTVPEAGSTLILLGMALTGLGAAARRMRR